LYLARPFSRTEYVLGKMSVLILLLSAMTWIPGLLLFALQSYMEGWAWMTNNLNIAAGLSLGAWIWILILSLLALAISAWVKWKPAAAVLMFGVFFIAAGFGGAINEVLRTKWGNLFSVPHLIGEVWLRMFSESSTRGGAMFFRVREEGALPLWCCWAALIGICLFCLYLLSRRIRGTEVVR
jgi:ABC-2 type transport system permease protein